MAELTKEERDYMIFVLTMGTQKAESYYDKVPDSQLVDEYNRQVKGE